MSPSRSSSTATKTVDPDEVAAAFARAIAAGDYVSFRTMFLPFSPGRASSTESFDDEKYDYLLPDDEETANPAYKKAMDEVRKEKTWLHIQKELEAERPAQLPANLLLMLADNAIRIGKYTSASQALELLRVRAKTQDLFFEEGDAALDRGDIAAGVRGYRIAAALEYDYSAFPEPLPAIPKYQERALILHGRYPKSTQETLAGQPPEMLVSGAISYLLNHGPAAARIENRDIDLRTKFAVELIRQTDPNWDAFRDRFLKACAVAKDFGKRMSEALEGGEGDESVQSLADEVAEQRGGDPMEITECLLGRTIPDGTWWQYLKDLAYLHPASVLFISRLRLGPTEILAPRINPNAPLIQALDLIPPK